MAGRKTYLGYHVLTGARARISAIFENFPKVYVSFSGGKDSTVMFHLCAEEARRIGRKFGVLFIDWECQYRLTIDHVREMLALYSDVAEPYWCCVPLKTVNAVSVFEPEWIAWENGKEWIREKPDISIKDGSYFPFYRYAMTFEEFVPAFGRWYSGNVPTACFVGIRTDESLNRWTTIAANRNKQTYQNRRWTTRCGTRLYNAYPIYDWSTEDIWTYCGRYGKCYNRLYDRFYQAGIPLGKMRICEPFGNEQRQALDYYQVIEPDTWGRLVARVNGANFGSVYARERGIILGNHRITKPDNHTWESFAKLLLNSMPQTTAEHYRNKIAVYLHWWTTKGNLPGGIPDEQPKDTGSRDVPSWRRICKCILKNDYWCRMLCFAPTKTAAYQKYCELMKMRREKWNLI
ncbi:phosphoadenosine phosphosulfate reductase [Victivallis vadensis]|uniref:DUF3440 domain-containing protein n=1 Tax=Victivallis vadensis TaxID=172901 RepID=A0A848B078_9BACT|nr:DUF3440 domain-containing protein [Victivallis vadensis]NMD87160.1 DUF3440 domain-containing protein [Victivallis vadensis]